MCVNAMQMTRKKWLHEWSCECSFAKCNVRFIDSARRTQSCLINFFFRLYAFLYMYKNERFIETLFQLWLVEVQWLSMIIIMKE